MKLKANPVPAWQSHSDALSVLGALFFMTFCLTPAGIAVFESSMIRHMLLQLPMLALAGAMLLPRCGLVPTWLARWDSVGAITLIAGSGWLLYWMLPVSLDMASIDPAHRVLKVISVPLGIGLCLRWTLRQAGPVLSIIIAFEAWASIARLGWLYTESPEQLCSSYLRGEQQIVGEILLILAAATGVAALAWGFLGSFGQPDQAP